MTPTVRSAAKAEIARCAEVLGEGFADDPLMSYIWPHQNRRVEALPAYFHASLRHHHMHGGGVQVTLDPDGDIAGVANWDPPGRWKQPLPRTIQAAPRLLYALRDRIAAALRVRGELDRHQPQQHHWYLANIGTAQVVRGAGYGAALLAARLGECDERALPAYLVCTKRENVEYYKGFGFDVTTEFCLPRGGPPLWAMWREPSA